MTERPSIFRNTRHPGGMGLPTRTEVKWQVAHMQRWHNAPLNRETVERAYANVLRQLQEDRV